MEFLRQIASLYLERERELLPDACFVFPNRRSSLFFQKYLGEAAGMPLLSPAVTTVNALFADLSDRVPADRIRTLYLLYGIYAEETGDRRETLDSFLTWGDMLLGDFSDVDKYLADPERLFSNIRDLRELDAGYDFLEESQREAVRQFWGSLAFGAHSASAGEASFRALWQVLPSVYRRINAVLADRGEAYEGALYRSVAEGLADPQHPVHAKLARYRRYVFVGLNALTACERKLLEHLQREDMADFYWDFFGQAVRDPENRASWLMQENVSRFPSRYSLPEKPEDFRWPEIRVVGVPSLVGQAKYAGRILAEEMPEDTDFFRTAVVLPKEEALDPLLESLPARVRKVNVTMGYPVRNSTVYTYLRALSALVEKKRVRRGGPEYYHATVTDLLDHPFLRNSEYAGRLRRAIAANNLIYVPVAFFESEQWPGPLFRDLPDTGGEDRAAAARRLADYLSRMLETVAEKAAPAEREFLYQVHTVLVRLRDLDVPLETRTWLRVLRQLCAGLSIPYRGEPLAGLQVMGPLETRALDFDRIILLSANEGVFPAQQSSRSLIPYNLRRGYGLPTYEHQDAMQAYYFYRMIGRASRVWILYDQRTDGLQTGEESRFVKQLRYQYRVPLQCASLESRIRLNPEEPLAVAKSAELLKQLRSRSYSASDLNNYLSCPMKFFFSLILPKEEDEVEEKVEAGTFGNIFHYVMERIYRDRRDAPLDAAFFRERCAPDAPEVGRLIAEAFRQELNLQEVSGKNRVIEALIRRGVRQVLEYDCRIPDLVIRRLEYRIPQPDGPAVMLQTPAGAEVRLKGFVDRIDTVGERWRIVDYKTGSSEMQYKAVSEMFDAASDRRPYTAFQLFFYLLLCHRSGLIADVDRTLLGVYSLKDLFRDGVSLLEAGAGELEEFAERLGHLLDEILDPGRPFVRTAAREAFRSPCTYCSYSKYCNAHYVKHL